MQRETLDVDVLVVGGGPAGLSAALRLAQLQRERGGDPLQVAVLEKARAAGAHSLSGAVLDPSALDALVPDWASAEDLTATRVERDEVRYLRRASSWRLPIVPPPLRNHGHWVVSVSDLVRWLAERVEAGGVDLFTGFAGQEVLFDGRRVAGVRTGERGRARDGSPKASYDPGVDVRARVTILCDGVRGNLTREVVSRLGLDEGRQPEQYAVGLKELWEIPAGRLRPGTVVHTLGYPLRSEEFGGGFIYGLPDGRVAIGLVAGLDYRDPLFDPHTAFNRFKHHPFVSALLEGGSLIRYGARALPEGGWNTIPVSHADGVLIAGDAGGYLNSMRLKGIHLAMWTGMLAGEAAFEALREGDTSRSGLGRYTQAIESGPVKAELYPVRNVHQAFGRGLLPGLAFAGLSILTGGRWPRELRGHAGHARMQTLEVFYGGLRPAQPAGGQADRTLTFDKVTNVHYSGTAHEEDQPSHLRVQTDVCVTRCGPEYGHPCLRFCPANVYEIVQEPGGAPRLQISASNCVHCKTCDIMDPYQVIRWVPPEGGDGPQFNGM